MVGSGLTWPVFSISAFDAGWGRCGGMGLVWFGEIFEDIIYRGEVDLCHCSCIRVEQR